MTKALRKILLVIQLFKLSTRKVETSAQRLASLARKVTGKPYVSIADDSEKLAKLTFETRASINRMENMIFDYLANTMKDAS